MKLHKIIPALLILLVSVSSLSAQNSHNSSNAPGNLRNVTWKIDQLYLDTLPIFSPAMDSLRYRFDDHDMVTLSAGELALEQKYSYNTGKKQFTIFFQDIPEETYDVVCLNAHVFIFRIRKQTDAGSFSMLEYRLIPE